MTAANYSQRWRRSTRIASAALLFAACGTVLLSLPSSKGGIGRSSSLSGYSVHRAKGGRNLETSNKEVLGGSGGILWHESTEGRLGNLLWEYAATIGLARKHGMKECVDGGWAKLLDRAFKGPFFRDCNKVQPSAVWGEAFPHRYTEFGKPPSGASVKLRGYLQSMKYFENCTDEVLQAFELKDKHQKRAEQFLQKWGVDKDGGPAVRVGVHIRDFSKENSPVPWVNTPPINYYQQAMEIMRKKYGQGRVKFFVASQWILDYKENAVFQFPDVVMLEDSRRTQIDDLAVFMNCDHMIMSVGTFGWWSAWLGAYQRGGDVIYYDSAFNMEHPFFGGKHKFDLSEKFPSEWKPIGESDLVTGGISHSESKA